MSSSSKARQRVLSLLDDNSFVEIGAQVTARSTDFNQKPEQTPSDGVITGYGVIDGSLVYVYSQDSTVLGGSVGEMHAKKIAAIYDLAIRTGAPVIGLIDSAGLRLQEASDALNAFGTIYAQQAKASGVVPQITAVFGTCGGGLALVSALSDFTMMADSASLFVNAPNALAGNSEDKNNTASAKAKAQSGNVDFVGTEDEVLAQVRTLAGLLPGNNEDEKIGPCTDELNRQLESAEAEAADPALLIADLADNGFFFETKKDYAKEMVTGFARLNGATVGFVGNRTALFDENGEVAEKFDNALTTAGAQKAADFVRFCDAYDLPIVSLTDVNGFAATEAEEKTVARAAASLTAAFADADTAKVNVITGEAVGSAYAVMNAKATGADFTFAFPEAKIALMESSLAAKVLADGKSADEKAAAAAAYDELQNSINSAAARGYVDQIVEPADLRTYLIGALEVLYTKREDRPAKKHSTR